MPFTPKFADLVRNVTTVQGTGPVTLGSAVSGYAGIAEALSPGDQFYYCIQGVDKPQEREVGRGTLQANGTIARQPVSGAPTNFTSGTKTIALVAAAEWFERVDGAGAGGASVQAVSRAELAGRDGSGGPAMLTEAGREGLFLFNAADLSAKVVADPRQGIYVPAAASPSGTAGAWVRSFSGAVNVRWFGAVGDDATDDGPAFAAAIAYCHSLTQSGYGYGKGSARLFIPAGRYFLGTTTLEITHSLIVEGENCGGLAGSSTVLRWAANTTGIRTQSYNTSGATGGAVSTSHLGASMATIRNLMLVGGFTDSEGEHHGIQMRVKSILRDLFISNFQGDGLHCVAHAGHASIEGNCNGSVIDNVAVVGCRDGMHFRGADTNAIQVFNPTINSVRRHGIVSKDNIGLNVWGGDSSTSGGGHVLAVPVYNKVSHAGKWYFVIAGQEAWASANPPSGTTAANAGWGYMPGPGHVALEFPAWSAGMNLRAAYPVWVDGESAFNSFAGFYSEGDQPPSMVSGHTRWDCPLAPAVHTDGELYGAMISSSAAGFSAPRSFRVGSTGTAWGVTPGSCLLSCDGNVRLTRDNSIPFDPFLFLNTTNAAAKVAFQKNGVDKYYLDYNAGAGMYYMCLANEPHVFRVNGNTILTFDAGGADLTAGKALKVAGTQVVGPQGAAVADATDAASAITQLNALLARMRAHGLIAS